MFGPPEKNPFLRNPEFNKEEYEQNLRVEAQLRKYEEEALKNTDILVLGCPESARVRLYDQVQKAQQAKSKRASGGGGARRRGSLLELGLSFHGKNFNALSVPMHKTRGRNLRALGVFHNVSAVMYASPFVPIGNAKGNVPNLDLSSEELVTSLRDGVTMFKHVCESVSKSIEMSVFVVLEHSSALEQFSKANHGFAKMFAAEFGVEDKELAAAKGGMVEAIKNIYQATFDNTLENSKSKVPDHIRRPELNISIFTGSCSGPHFALFIENTLTTIEETEDAIVKEWDMDSEICNVKGLEGKSVRASKIADGDVPGGSSLGGWLSSNKMLVATVAVIAVAAVAAAVISRRKKEM